MIGFAGLTHLGLVSAAATAEKGFSVVAFDPDRALVDKVAAGRLPVSEPGLDDLLARRREKLRYGADAAALRGCDVVYISADVPTDAQGRSALARIEDLIGRVLPVLGATASLVVLCQVPPGFTRAIELSPERLYYQVETLVFGRAVERALAPERFIVGCADPSERLPPAYERLLAAFGCPVLPMRYESAELAKISINFFLISSISTTNMLAEVCEHVGADWR